jgi:hypothetical protein
MGFSFVSGVRREQLIKIKGRSVAWMKRHLLSKRVQLTCRICFEIVVTLGILPLMTLGVLARSNCADAIDCLAGLKLLFDGKAEQLNYYMQRHKRCFMILDRMLW